MILLTFSIAISDVHTRLARLEADAPLVAAVGTAEDRHVLDLFVTTFSRLSYESGPTYSTFGVKM
jgi:hypothetical protein